MFRGCTELGQFVFQKRGILNAEDTHHAETQRGDFMTSHDLLLIKWNRCVHSAIDPAADARRSKPRHPPVENCDTRSHRDKRRRWALRHSAPDSWCESP